ncbi:CorA-like Mg2+ transporter protein [Pirellulimonas nuda]|uniref:CorA-like Mg2+ transporter protein n=1 Tax=Pirellulimonas nuda TaxID=2528009 RepID=A0A518D5Y1_9BACT|nr:CorA family divalent cation transporter [Pirellulimonas nuda]QDU86870.1 CorA-like Mg2+ transporter protein [Pirellulimonas nuda]
MPLLPSTWTVPDVFRDRLGDDVGRQRLMQADGHTLLVLHAPPQADQDNREGRFFWRDPQGQWSPGGMVHGQLAIGELLAEYEKALDRVDAQEDTASSAKEYFDLMRTLHPLTRATHNLHTVLQKAREEIPDDRRLIVLRDKAYALSRQAELLQQDVQSAIDYAIARRAEEQAESGARQATAAHRLNVLAALFFPIATLGAIYGMNLQHGLEGIDAQYGPWPLMGMIAGGLAAGAVIAGIVTRK